MASRITSNARPDQGQPVGHPGYEFRNPPTADANSMKKELVSHATRAQAAMKNIATEAGFSFETICEVPAFLGSADGAVTRTLA